MKRCKTRLLTIVMSLMIVTWSAGSARAALIGNFVHNFGSVVITLNLFDGQPGGKYLWQYTVENITFDPNPGTSNGFSGFELFLPSPIPEIADIVPNPGSVPPWDIDCCSGNPVEWDIMNSDGNGVMPGNSMIFSFTTDPRLVAINDDGWFHTWQNNVQTDVSPTLGMHVPFVPGLQPPLCGNGVLDPGEECDPPGSSPGGAFPCPPESPGGAFVPCNAECTCETLTTTTTTSTLATTSTSSTTMTTSTTVTTTSTMPEHFQCYEVKPAAFPHPTVQVQDQFGTLPPLTLRFPHRLCAPASKNNEGIQDPTEHLAGYRTTAAFTKRLDQTIVNQFGSIRLDVVRPDMLMVPTAKDGVPINPPAGDHFMCYKVKRSHGTPKFVKLTVSVADQFQNVTETLVKPYRLCAPANKNGEDPTAPSHPGHLLCYKTKSATKFGTIVKEISNQFGPDEVTLIHRRELCVPSLKNPQTPTTTTTSTTTTSTQTTLGTSSTTATSTTSTSSTSTSTTSTSTSTTTTTTRPYGSPSRAFVERVESLLD